ncbi:DNA topoisomerase 2-like [Bradysia coprophila]|uniref:DNA topoisomerase 2-like n=1 Tax=Bradysia coprophila TaxID=38358 RepID=UPI00187D9B4D|nr:DNA topoisomerase 2-like [Bradysia coprophila]
MSDEGDNEVTSKDLQSEADDAGTENGYLCSLILADGWTALEVAIAGLSVVGRKQYGMYGLINVTQDASHKNVADMFEIVDLMKITGLQYNVDYSSESERKKLRYGKLMMLTDQNEGGTHFKGLIISFIYSNWPALLHTTPPFLEEIITPVVKVTRGLNKLSFYSMAEFEQWKKTVINIDAYTVRHYRGLGTNNWNEIKEYFSNMDFHRVKFEYGGPEDDENLMKAFDKGAIKQLRGWLTHHMVKCKRHKLHGFQDSHLYTKKTNAVTYSDFINSEYVFFASYNNANSIPSVVDGFKPGQRKVLFTCIKREFKIEVRVSQLAYCVAEDTAYYESEQTICKFVYDMVQDYVGSNNISLMIPFGQFGTRLMGGEDHADQHSLRTLMAPLTRLIFHPHDDPLLTYKFDEDKEIEPEWYIPVIPMLLVNGSEGTGTGWSTYIPKHDPHQLIRSLRNMITGKLPDVLTPFYRNFRGTILAVSSSRFITIGCVAIIEDEKIEITELPIGTWTTSYKVNVLEQLLRGSETVKPIITDYKEYQTDTTVRFVVSFAPGEFDKLQKEISGFHRVFQLFGIIKTDNMYAFDNSNTLRKFELAHDILQEFYVLRLKYYVKRKQYLEGKLTAEADKLKNQVDLVLAKSDSTFVVENKTRKAILDELIERGYQADPVEKWKKENGIETGIVETKFQHLSDKERTDAKNFDYLLNMSMWTLTEERKIELINQCYGKKAELEALQSKSEYDLWLADLDELEAKLKELEEMKRVNSSKRVGNKNLYPSDDGKIVEFQLTNALYDEISKMDRDE